MSIRRSGVFAIIAVSLTAAIVVYIRSLSTSKPVAPATHMASPPSFGSSDSPGATPSTFTASPQGAWLARAPAGVARRRGDRVGFAWILRQFGASEATLDRIAQGDLKALMIDLKRQASTGDATAINTLGWLASRCAGLRQPDVLDSYDARQKQDAQALPQTEATWLTSLIDQDEAREHELEAACAAQINQDEIETMLSARADQGDGGSLWLLSESAGNVFDLRTLLRQAAAAGFPEAEYELALQLLGSQDPQWHLAGDPAPMDLLREAAVHLPDARANLAVCELRGCDGSTPDLTAAVSDARSAAQSGQPAAMLSLSTTLPTGALDPNEGAAWQLFATSLEQQGCRVDTRYVAWLKGIDTALSSPAMTPQVQALANQYWQRYGAAAEAQLGCGP
jgi:hypothetical protein